MKKELIYVLACYLVNMLTMASMFWVIGEIAGETWSVIGIATISIIFGLFTGTASMMVYWLWLRLEVVVILTKDTAIEDGGK